MTVERDNLNRAEHENQPTHRLEDMDVYKVDLVKSPATGDAFLAIRSKDDGGKTVPRRRAMSTTQFRQQYRPEDGSDSVTIAQRGDPVPSEQTPGETVTNQPGVTPETEKAIPPVIDAEQGVQRKSNNDKGDSDMKEILERMDKLTNVVTGLVTTMKRSDDVGTPEPVAPATPVVPKAVDDAVTSEPEAPAPAAPAEPKATDDAATPAEPKAMDDAATPAEPVTPVVTPVVAAPSAPPVADTASVERMTANMEVVSANMEAVARGVEATSNAVIAMGSQVTTIVASVVGLTKRMESVERSLNTSNAAPQDETESEAGDKPVERAGGTFKGLLFGPRIQG